MKKKLLAFLLFGMVIINSAFASSPGDEVNGKTLRTFSEQFAKATDVSWETTAKFYKSTFELNGQYLIAFFSKEGELIGVTQNITSTELPYYLKSALEYNYPDYWINNLFESSVEGETKYYVTIENEDQQLTLESGNSSYWTLFQKARKH